VYICICVYVAVLFLCCRLWRMLVPNVWVHM